MFQERAPGALVIGEEHFTCLGYHSKRRCQVPMQTSSAVTRGHLARTMLRGHGITVSLSTNLLSKEWRSSPSSSARRGRRHCWKATSRGDRNPTGRSLKAGHPETQTEFAAGWSERGMLRPHREIEARDRQCLEQYEAPKGYHCVGGTLHPQTVATMPDHPSGWATPPTIPCFRKEPPGHLSSGRNILRS